LLPRLVRRFRYPGRQRLDDRQVLQGILFVLHTGIGWEHLLQELGFAASNPQARFAAMNGDHSVVPGSRHTK
jgi:transposase